MHVIGTSARPDLPLAVVVGAGALGMAMARRMAQNYRVLLADVDAERTEANAAMMRTEGCDAVAFACDVTDPDAVMALADEVGRRGGLGALVYVAGLSPSAAQFEAIMRVNLIGAARVCEVLLPHTAPGSAAVLISSLAAHAVVGSLPAYAATKGAIDTLVKHFSSALGRRGIRVNAIAPGVVATDMSSFTKTSEGRDYTLGLQSLKRIAQADDIGDAVAFLASSEARWITGDTIHVDGGSKL